MVKQAKYWLEGLGFIRQNPFKKEAKSIENIEGRFSPKYRRTPGLARAEQKQASINRKIKQGKARVFKG